MVKLDSLFDELKEAEEPLCVRFANTVGNRFAAEPAEYLTSPARLSVWLERNGLSSPDFKPTEATLKRARVLREAIYSLLSEPDAKDVSAQQDLNREVSGALKGLSLNSALQWELAPADAIDRVFMLIALSAARLLTSPDRAFVRRCALDECGWLFLDRSKNHSRRWCSMSDCGNLAKARRFQARRKR